ncbi:phenylalanine--tRNA ligase subunit beta [Oleispirillum naphthae]|uniref:phenylalanine--tRNA ligase subunit beta n=1 Tax=Oleispirillum naphthae TaxID=2838853 RepID=UPI0030825B6A
MKFTLSWLRDYLETDLPLAELADAMTALGLEVEGIEDPAAALADFIVADVVTCVDHPDSDHLHLLSVNTGSETLQIVCGAPNAHAGMKGILARVGTRIPATGDVLKTGKIRGIESQGMMCSFRELGLGEDHAGIVELETDAPAGTPVAEVLALDPVIDLSITPNRADCLGVRGVARDLAAKGLGAFKDAPVPVVQGSFDSPVSVALDFPKGEEGACPMFVGRFIRGVKNRPSPQWLQDRLTAVGLRPISALVDITNYVSLSRARPLHVFDADKIAGGALTVRLAEKGETVAALDGRTYEMEAGMVVICDAAGAQSIAGVMGGEPTGCTEDTVNVFVESALFDPLRVAHAGRTLQIDSDARYRFERGVDPASVADGAELATALILEFCGGTASHPVVAGAVPGPRAAIAFRPERVKTLGGLDVPAAEMADVLARLGCAVAVDGAALTVTPPTWRGDIAAEHDLVEEVLRVVGYDNVPAAPMPRDPMPKVVLTDAQRRRGWMRRALAARGLTEAVTFSFMDSRVAGAFGWSDPMLKVDNPISSELDVMRPSVLPNLVSAAARNAARGIADAALFEIGPQFDGPEPGQQRLAAAGVRTGKTGPRHWGAPPRAADAFDAKADAFAALEAAGAPTANAQVHRDAPAWYHPGQSGTIKLGRTVLAAFGALHPGVVKKLGLKGRAVGFEVYLDAIPAPKKKANRTRPLLKVSPYPAVDRDFAFVVDEAVEAERLIRAVTGADKALVQSVSVFDVFAGPALGAGRKSVALAVTLQAMDRTLKDEEIEAAAKTIVAAVEKATGGVLRA